MVWPRGLMVLHFWTSPLSQLTEDSILADWCFFGKGLIGVLDVYKILRKEG